jgi:hypothetical protein
LLSRTRPVQKTQLQAADSSRQGCENQSKGDADRCPPGAPSSQSEQQNQGTEFTVGAFNINALLIFVKLSLSNTM